MRKVRPALLKGFDQEFLPHEQLQFNALIELIRRNFERFGFLPIETPSAERIEVLTSKGGAEKEIYALSRLAAGEEEDAAAKGALRFDLTVPLARYVAMRERELAFPFRRYQIQGVLRHFDVADERSGDVLRALDKTDKEDQGAVIADLERNGLAGKGARELYELIGTKRGTDETLALLGKIPLAAEGLSELQQMVQAIRMFGVPDSAFAIDLSVVRGLDYYTGTIYETTLLDHPDIGSICSGGRYDDLASYFTNTRLPGVGISIGLSRLFARLKDANLLRAPGRTPAEVLVTTLDPDSLERYLQIAVTLRAHDINTEVYLERAKIGKQFEYANKKGFRVAITAGADEFSRGTVKVKDLSAQAESDVPLDQVAARVQTLLDPKVH